MGTAISGMVDGAAICGRACSPLTGDGPFSGSLYSEIVRPTELKPKKLDRSELASIISRRLQLDEEWSPMTAEPFFRKNVREWRHFCSCIHILNMAGCRWDVVLACVSRFMTYNQSAVLHPLTYDSDGEAEGVLVWEWKDIPPPPKAEERDAIKKDLNAVLRHLRKHQELLHELGAAAPPDIPEFEELATERSLHCLPILLGWGPPSG
jgi:hypothetical protein